MPFHSHRFLLVASLLLYLAAGGFLSRRFPPVNSDELVIATTSFNFLSGQGLRYSQADDLFAPSAYAMRDLSTQVSRPLYNAWAGLWMKMLPRTYWHARWSALAAGLLTLLLIDRIGRLMQRSSWGLLGVGITLLNPLWWVASVVVNEHIVLLLGAMVVFYLALRPPSFPWKDYGIGALAGLLILIHPHAVLFFAGLVCFVFARDPHAKTLSKLLSLGAGFTTGAILSLCCVDMAQFLLYQQSIYWEFVRPPLVSHPWSPIRWWVGAMGALWKGPTYYFDSRLATGWEMGLAFFWGATGLVLIGGAAAHGWSRRAAQRLAPAWGRSLAAGLLGTMIAMTALVKRPEAVYHLILFPFLIPLVSWCWQAMWAQKSLRFLALVSLGVWLIGMGRFWHFAARYSQGCKPFPLILREVRSLLPQGRLRVAGPNVFWFDYPPDDFRDLGCLVVSRYYTGGRWDLQAWLGRWRPDILIIDPNFRRVFLQGRPILPALPPLLGAAVEYLGSVDTHNAYGRLDVCRIRWR